MCMFGGEEGFGWAPQDLVEVKSRLGQVSTRGRSIEPGYAWPQRVSPPGVSHGDPNRISPQGHSWGSQKPHV